MAGECPLHKSVLLEQALEDLAPRDGGRYLDGTLGLGGHARAILESAPGSVLCGLDRDGEALEIARERLASFGERAKLFHLPFSRYEEALDALGWDEIDGVLLDLGVSSMQLDSPDRGFSFRTDGPLDMRMDRLDGAPGARELVNRGTFDELKKILTEYGEEPLAGKIARRIIEVRSKEPVNTTARLAEIIRLSYPPEWRRSARNHPATRAFQALRMAVNDEAGELVKFLGSIFERLAVGGRAVIISFHSLEDRFVKRAMKKWEKGECQSVAGEPGTRSCFKARLFHKKPVMASDDEKSENPRARSAKLRACEKIKDEVI